MRSVTYTRRRPLFYIRYRQILLWPDLPYLCGNLMISMTFGRQKNRGLLGWRYVTGIRPLLTPSHSFQTCGGLEAFTSATSVKKCGVETSSDVLHPDDSLVAPLSRTGYGELHPVTVNKCRSSNHRWSFFIVASRHFLTCWYVVAMALLAVGKL